MYLVSNYNLIVHIIVSLSLQRVNIPKEPILSTFATLQKMTHLARTAFRESQYTQVCLGVDIPRVCHSKRASRFCAHNRNDSVHAWLVAPVCARLIKYPFDRSRCNEVIQLEPQAILDCGFPPKSPLAASHTQPVSATRRGDT